MKSVSICCASPSSDRAPPWMRSTRPSRARTWRSRWAVTGDTEKSRASSLIEAPPLRRTRSRIWRRRASAGSCSDIRPPLHPLFERPAPDVHLQRPELVDRLDEVAREPVQCLLALRGRGAERVADDAGLGELSVVHREREVLITAELDV